MAAERLAPLDGVRVALAEPSAAAAELPVAAQQEQVRLQREAPPDALASQVATVAQPGAVA